VDHLPHFPGKSIVAAGVFPEVKEHRIVARGNQVDETLLLRGDDGGHHWNTHIKDSVVPQIVEKPAQFWGKRVIGPRVDIHRDRAPSGVLQTTLSRIVPCGN
jgi:hypothetical protein